MLVMYRWHVLLAFINEMIWRLVMTPMPLYVYKVVKYKDDHWSEDVSTDYADGNVLLNTTIGDTERIEYRVTWKRTSKYRIVLTKEWKECTINPAHELFAGAFGLSSKPKILRATLKNHDDASEDNVMDRVLKFAGPRHDFFGNGGFKMGWMFENDYLHDNIELDILLSNGKSFTYAPSDVISF